MVKEEIKTYYQDLVVNVIGLNSIKKKLFLIVFKKKKFRFIHYSN